MATENKDFKVKNGLIVALGGTFGGTVTVATPTEDTHATTRLYVDDAISAYSVPIQLEAPSLPNEGQLYIDSDTERIYFYYNGTWVAIANFNDTADIKQHIHDTSIGGTGIIVSVFQDGGYYNSMFSSEQDSGYYNFNEWAMEWNGGIAIDNFN